MPGEEKRPTIRNIAEKTGFSTMTVSLALRHHPKIPAATRASIRKVADKLGYRPDPQLAKLMHHLRRGRQPHFQSTIAALTDFEERDERPYHRFVIEGAKRRASALGYRLEVFRSEHSTGRNASLQRILRSRGVEGVLLLPMHHAEPLTRFLDWKQFSVVAATAGVPSPGFHRVVPHHFANTLLLSENLSRLGYRRIGLVLDRDFDVLITPGFSAALLWQQAVGLIQLATPLLHESGKAPDVRAWFEREKPDAIIVRGFPDADEMVRALGLKFPGPVGIAVSNLEGSRVFAGIDGYADEIGAAAVDLLNSKILTGERGVPNSPVVAMIQGRWTPGPSVRRRAPREG